MVFGRNFCEKRQIRVPEPHFWEVRADARPWLMVRRKAHDRLSIRVIWTFFAIYYSSGVMRRNVYSWADFTGGRPFFHSDFTWTGSSPINHSWRQKTRDAGLPDGEDYIILRSVILTQYRSVTDRQTDEQICRSIYSACKASFAAHVKIIIIRNYSGKWKRKAVIRARIPHL